jgi:hypothetical protein
MLTAVLAVKLIRQILVDYNSWPGSESDSALKISRAKTLDEKAILSRDAGMRRLAEKNADPTAKGYKPPVRRVTEATLVETFLPLVKSTGTECESQFQLVKTDVASITTLEPLIEKTEFLVQLYSAFTELLNPKVFYVLDGDAQISDPYTGFFITGTSSDGEVIIAQTLLIQT